MRAPLAAMGQVLFEPPDVTGWELGQGWFSTGAMLARMNFASRSAANQRFNRSPRRPAAAESRPRRWSTSSWIACRRRRTKTIRYGELHRLPERRRRLDRVSRAAEREGCRAVAIDCRVGRIPVGVEGRSFRDVNLTTPDSFSGGVSAFTFSFAAPAFLNDIARAQGARARNLVVVYLSGGNDSLSTVVPYLDPFYYSRRPTIAVPAVQVLQIGTDSSGKALGLHPRLAGLKRHFQRGPSRRRAADRLSQFQPIALPGARHLGHGQPRRSDRRRVAWPLSRNGAGRSARRVERHAGTATGAAVARRQRARDPERRHLRVQ